MSKESQLRQVLDSGIVAVVRAPDSQQLVETVRALIDGGVNVVEITMTVPDALDVVRQVRKALGDRILLGAGTILDPETARAALLAGAEFLVAPTLNLDVIRLCQRYDKLVMPAGGVDLNTAADFLKAGACCLGVGSQLVEPKAITERNFDRIRDLARQYVAVVRKFREG